MKRIIRGFARSPMFTAVAALTLAFGIGANTAIFSVLNAVLIQPLPYPDSDRLVAVWQTISGPGVSIPEINASPATYYLYREEGRTFQDIGLWRTDAVTVTGLAEPERVLALSVTDGALPAIGVQPALGRWFTPKDDSPGSPETAMLAYGYWQRRFGGDPSVLGRRIMIDGQAHEVIGILPGRFRFMNAQHSVVLPLQFDRNKVFVGHFSYQAVARMKPGVTLAQANADVARMLPMLPLKFPPAPGMSNKVFEEIKLGPSVRPLKQDVVGDVGKTLWVLMATVGIVLFIACANVANLLLVRAEGRQRELAIRAALGAGRSRLARELLLESAALGLIGGAIGVVLAHAGLRLLTSLAPSQLPRIDEIAIDRTALLFTLALSLAAGVLFGLIPVFKYAGPKIAAGLRGVGRTHSDSRERHRARSALVVVQVALALALLVASGLMIRTFQALRRVDPGFTSPSTIQTLRVSIPSAQVPDVSRAIRMHNDILNAISAIPGVTSVAATNSITMDGSENNDPIYAEDRSYAEGQMPPMRRYKYISPGLFKTMGTPLIAGRDLTWTDIYDRRPVVIVSQNMARELWGDPAAAIGKRVRESPKGRWREIVGVAGDERDDGVDRKAPAVVYWPLLVKDFWQFPERGQRMVAFTVRSSRAGTMDFIREIQRAVWGVNPELPVADVRTVQEIYDRSMARTSLTLTLLGIAAGMALLLGVVGIYGVISYSVSQRTREIGIRVALGAPGSQVRRMFVRHGLALAAVGLGCGLLVAAALTRIMAALLFEVSPLDPLTYLAVSLTILAAAALATYIPACRATAVSPLDALRAD
ncbi:MAG: ABC transporter permease [Bryobacteraceae bacterium]|nr:ABC transporter permease [Bryobacteraceae bacterium]